MIAASARKHGIHDHDMIHAFNHPMFVDDLDDGFVMFVGADTAGNLLEVGVIDSTDGPDHRPRHAGTTEVPQVIPMPRTAQEILDHADELAARFEQAEPAGPSRRHSTTSCPRRGPGPRRRRAKPR